MKLFYIFLFVVLFNCSSDGDNTITNTSNNNDNNTTTSVWCVPTSNIAGGVLKFPTIDSPNYKSVSEMENINFLGDNSKLALLKLNSQVYVFPYDYTNYSEVVNDTFGMVMVV